MHFHFSGFVKHHTNTNVPVIEVKVFSFFLDILKASKRQKMPSTLTKFTNCRILRNHKFIRDDLWVEDGKILDPEKVFFDEKRRADIQYDCNNAIIAPGFIDVQINGALGFDFSYPTDDIQGGVQKVAKSLLSHGVTSFCPTIVTSPSDLYKKLTAVMKRTEGSSEGAGVLGLHLEGPFINVEKRGAHSPEYIMPMKNGFEDVLNTYVTLEETSIVTLAPELPNALAVIERLAEKGIVVSLGHSTANLAQGEAGVKAGATFITHLFNAMLPFHHRDPHLVGLLASDRIPEDRKVFYGLIADGIHTEPSAIKIAHRANKDGLVLVTDAIPAMGLKAGTHTIGPQKVEIKNDRAVIAGTDTLCGSIATLNDCVKFIYNTTECTAVEALEAASLHQAQLLGITDRKGSLCFHTDADFVLLDDDLTVQATYIAGEQVWASPEVGKFVELCEDLYKSVQSSVKH